MVVLVPYALPSNGRVRGWSRMLRNKAVADDEPTSGGKAGAVVFWAVVIYRNNVHCYTRTGHRNSFGSALALSVRSLRCYRDAAGDGANDPRCMDKPRWLLAQTAAKGLVLLLGLSLLLGEGSLSFARDNAPDSLNRQVLELYQQGKYQEAIPFAEKLLTIRKQTFGPDHPDTALDIQYPRILKIRPRVDS